MEAGVLFGLGAVLLALNIPIAVALGSAAIATIWLFGLATIASAREYAKLPNEGPTARKFAKGPATGAELPAARRV